jgi:flagellar protein FlgJ
MTPEEYIQKYGAAAQAASQKTGVPASTILAQSALESGWGISSLAQKFLNFFGIKSSKSWAGGSTYVPTTEYENGERVTTMASFRTYDSADESFLDWASLMLKPRYAGVRNASDGYAAADALQSAGYATDPNYASKLKSIITEYGLTSLDEGIPKPYPPAANASGGSAGITTASSNLLPSVSSFSGIFVFVVVILLAVMVGFLVYKLVASSANGISE